MKAWSFQQPWLHAVLHFGKRLDNRPRSVAYRGEILLHASMGYGSRQTYEEAYLFTEGMRTWAEWQADGTLPPFDDVPRGGICGIARIVDCHPPGDLFLRGERWYMPERDGVPQYGIILADVAPLPFTACKGALGLWSYEPQGELLEAVEAWRRSRAA